MRTGILGGAFDPPHSGHLIIAEAAAAALALDEVRFIPYAIGPHRPEGTVAAAGDRLNMTRLAVEDRPGLVCDGREVRAGGTSYTVDTLRGLQQEFPAAEFFLILGSDQFALIHTWRDWVSIVEMVGIAVIARPGGSREDPAPALAGKATWVEHPPIPISSTDLRTRIAAGADVGSLVPDSVARYIEEHRLYQE